MGPPNQHSSALLPNPRAAHFVIAIAMGALAVTLVSSPAQSFNPVDGNDDPLHLDVTRSPFLQFEEDDKLLITLNERGRFKGLKFSEKAVQYLPGDAGGLGLVDVTQSLASAVFGERIFLFEKKEEIDFTPPFATFVNYTSYARSVDGDWLPSKRPPPEQVALLRQASKRGRNRAHPPPDVSRSLLGISRSA